jgi:hypothetical protein
LQARVMVSRGGKRVRFVLHLFRSLTFESIRASYSFLIIYEPIGMCQLVMAHQSDFICTHPTSVLEQLTWP